MKSKEILDIVYDKLDFKHGQLYDAIEQPSKNIDIKTWVNKGEWLTAAKRAGAEKVFFIDNNPIIVFAKCSGNEEEKISSFNKLWSLARPRILFLEQEGELSVIDLAQKPVIQQKDETKKIESLEILNKVQDVAEKLQAYHRNHVESGKVFEKGRFGSLKNRADKALISDLKVVRNELMNAGLNGKNRKYAHALIGRSIFIRYLEDRNILTEEYFKKVASRNSYWMEILNSQTYQERNDFSGIFALYPRVLQNKEFTYALFQSLSVDFNGDMFPEVEQEARVITAEHLNLIQDLFYGDVGIQRKLFFHSYKFDIIPLDLISSIYEEFYHSTSNEDDKKTKARQDGAYYTPSVLAEFVLSRVLTVEELKKKPKILDPACGSGIFLVEAFRRMVRFEWKQKHIILNFNALKKILGRQISGIEINEEAARITAFSLYLAMLHYLDPPSIQKQIKSGNRLPNLLVSEKKSENHFNSIHVENAFNIKKDKLGKFDIVIGNPPWGAPGNNADTDTKERQKIMLDYCDINSYPIGDKEPSQAFLWKALDFLKKDGQCALLTSAGVLFKHSSTSQAFRRKWMEQVRLKEVFNFTHVRKFFFKGAISPFVMIHFTKAKQKKHPVEYWSAKQVVALKETQAVLFSKYDKNYLVGQDLTDNKTWKINWFGRHADTLFIKSFDSLGKLEFLIDAENSGRGFQESNKKHNSDWLLNFKELPSKQLSRYDSLSGFVMPPKKVEARGKSKKIYSENRIIIKRGISQKNNLNNQIVSRFVNDDFCFRNSVHCLKLKENNRNDYLLIQGILWSSFIRFYMFNISSNWGLWHDEIHLEEVFNIPVPTLIKSEKIISIVNKLRNYNPQERNIIRSNGVPINQIENQRSIWEAELDEAVYDLYEFSDEQRDLIRDCCEVTLPFFYQPYNSEGILPAIEKRDTTWIKNYAEIFARRWQPYLNEDEVMRADVHIGASGNLVAFEFYPADKNDNWDLVPKKGSWDTVLDKIAEALPKPMGTSQIVLDGLVHVISNDAIIIIKRNEKRFWTRSLAREDAASTLCKRMFETMPQEGGIK